MGQAAQESLCSPCGEVTKEGWDPWPEGDCKEDKEPISVPSRPWELPFWFKLVAL